jgi:A/G-specific adenine glycosylase
VDKAAHATKLLRWYDRHGRDLPWRVRGVHPDPYHVWLSEIMLQQTVVKAVLPYFDKFTGNWPSVEDLAAADLDDVLRAWAGLGYYARARNLHACAQVVAKEYDGRFPADEKALLALPGIGPYTAAAIRAIGFGKPAVVVDGNVERVVARLFAVTDPLPGVKPLLREKAALLAPRERPGDYAEAMMDLGATICTPKQPQCRTCPFHADCLARQQDCAAALPAREAKKPKPVRTATAFVAVREDGAVLLRRRPDKGLLAKMMEVPSTPWTTQGEERDDPQVHAPLDLSWRRVPGRVTHVFTHFRLELDVLRCDVPDTLPLRSVARPEHCHWSARRDLANEALPGVMRKILRHGLDEPLA